MSPDDPTQFYQLIRDSVAITIATEPHYLHDLKLDDDLTSDIALEAVLRHIETALA